MPMLTWLAMHKTEWPEWFVYVLIAFVVVCAVVLVALLINIIKYR